MASISSAGSDATGPESIRTNSTDALQRYLASDDSVQADALLTTIVFDHALPIIKRTTRSRLYAVPQQEREDVEGDVTLQLVKRLKSLKERGGDPINDFAGYTAVAAHNGCDEHFRRLYPQRQRLKNRLRYLISKSPTIVTWHDPDRGLVCGPALWQKRPVVTAPTDIVDKMGIVVRSHEETLKEVFRVVESPLELDALVEVFAALWNVKDQAHEQVLTEGATISTDRPADEIIQQDQSMRALWGEILNLPLSQRIALLLNLRDPSGGSALWLIASHAVASVRKIAELLEFQAKEFADLWPQLPLSDLDIAQRLGVERQQVINLRQAARQRLGRKLRSKQPIGERA